MTGAPARTAGRKRAAAKAPTPTEPMENDLLAAIRELCKYVGLLIYHTHDSRRSEPGFPDLVIVGPGGVLYRELKSEKGPLRPEQRDWLEALSLAGEDAAIWRPSDLISGRIVRELQAIRSPRTA